MTENFFHTLAFYQANDENILHLLTIYIWSHQQGWDIKKIFTFTQLSSIMCFLKVKNRDESPAVNQFSQLFLGCGIYSKVSSLMGGNGLEITFFSILGWNKTTPGQLNCDVES